MCANFAFSQDSTLTFTVKKSEAQFTVLNIEMSYMIHDRYKTKRNLQRGILEPLFVGGEDSVRIVFQKNIHLTTKPTKPFESVFWVCFIIKADGSISDIRMSDIKEPEYKAQIHDAVSKLKIQSPSRTGNQTIDALCTLRVLYHVQ